MIYQLSDGDVTKYKNVSEENDIDDFYLWISFKNRQSNIEKYLMNKDNDGTTNKVQKQTFKNVDDIPKDLLKKFTG